MNVGLSGNYFRNYNVQRKPEPKPDERKTVEKEMIQGLGKWGIQGFVDFPKQEC